MQSTIMQGSSVTGVSVVPGSQQKDRNEKLIFVQKKLILKNIFAQNFRI